MHTCRLLSVAQLVDHALQMFRRRTTDQVYATLQQVQRRITEQGANQPAPTAGARPFAGMPPRQIPSTVLPSAIPQSAGFGPAAAIGGLASAPLDQPELSSAPPPRGLLQLPLQVAVTLALLWLGTLGAAYYIGLKQGQADDHSEGLRPTATTSTTPTADTTTTKPAAKPLDPETPVSGKRIGDSILVLLSVPTANDSTRAEWQREVDRLNGIMRQYADRGWKPWFSLRSPDSGGMQLAFGFADGAWGIDRSKFEDLAKLLQATRDKGGGGFSTAKWVTIE